MHSIAFCMLELRWTDYDSQPSNAIELSPVLNCSSVQFSSEGVNMPLRLLNWTHVTVFVANVLLNLEQFDVVLWIVIAVAIQCARLHFPVKAEMDREKNDKK